MSGNKMMKLTSVVTMVALMGPRRVFGTPHPECEPCAAVSQIYLESLESYDKYLCCDLSCATTPVDGCGIFGLPIVCKACYLGDSTPAYDDPPIDDGEDSDAPSPSTPTPVTVTEEPVMPVMPVSTTPSPVASQPPPTEEPVMPVSTTPSPVASQLPPTTETDGSYSYTLDDDSTTTSDSYSYDDDDGSYSYSYDDECSPCDKAAEMLTEEDWIALEDEGFQLVCDPDCLFDAGLDGCGAFGMDTQCRAVLIEDDDRLPSATDSGDGGSAPTPSATDSGDGGSAPTASATDSGDGGFSPTASETDSGDGGSAPTTSGTDSGDGGSAPTTSGTDDGDAGSCSQAEIEMCADLSPAQEEALAQYDNGGKVIVCDPTCVSGNPSHCNYFGLGQLCRGCGDCSECVPCP